jgi:phospholipase/carboxylesterase
MESLNFFEIVPDEVNNLMLLLHGYGSNANDLLSIGINIKELLPNTAFLFVNAPTPCENHVEGCNQWFSLKTMNLFTILKEIKRSHILLNHLIIEQIKRFNISPNNLIIGGFSQGAMMSLYTGLRQEQQPLGLISFSGMLPDTLETLKKDIRNRTNVCLIHGDLDNVVPYNSMSTAEEIFMALDVPCSSFTIENMRHEINEDALKSAKNFICDLCNNIFLK